jgi:hypothetical protein
VAIKIVERALGNMDQEDENAREALVAASVSHPNVVKLLSCAAIGMRTHFHACERIPDRTGAYINTSWALQCCKAQRL